MKKTDVPETDTWLVVQKSGLKLRFDKTTQELTEIEIYTNPDQNQSKLNFMLKGQSIRNYNPSLEQVQQIMF